MTATAEEPGEGEGADRPDQGSDGGPESAEAFRTEQPAVERAAYEGIVSG